MAHKLKFRKARIIVVEKDTTKKKINKADDTRHKALKTKFRVSKYGNLYIETRAKRSD